MLKDIRLCQAYKPYVEEGQGGRVPENKEYLKSTLNIHSQCTSLHLYLHQKPPLKWFTMKILLTHKYNSISHE